MKKCIIWICTVLVCSVVAFLFGIWYEGRVLKNIFTVQSELEAIREEVTEVRDLNELMEIYRKICENGGGRLTLAEIQEIQKALSPEAKGDYEIFKGVLCTEGPVTVYYDPELKLTALDLHFDDGYLENPHIHNRIDGGRSVHVGEGFWADMKNFKKKPRPSAKSLLESEL